jgi:hypothetical protein
MRRIMSWKSHGRSAPVAWLPADMLRLAHFHVQATSGVFGGRHVHLRVAAPLLLRNRLAVPLDVQLSAGADGFPVWNQGLHGDGSVRMLAMRVASVRTTTPRPSFVPTPLPSRPGERIVSRD